jgi:hypothetical protein
MPLGIATSQRSWTPPDLPGLITPMIFQIEDLHCKTYRGCVSHIPCRVKIMKYVVFDPTDGKTVRDANEDEIDLFVDKQCDEYRAAVDKGDYRLAAWLIKTVPVIGTNYRVDVDFNLSL